MGKFFPLFIDLSDKKIVAVGGGVIASRRVGKLISFTSGITVIAPEVTDEMKVWEKEGKITICLREFSDEDVKGASLVLAVTNDEKRNEEIHRLAKAEGALVNVSSNRSLCDFNFPALAGKKEVVVGVSAGGKDHRKAREIARKIDKIL